MDERVDCPVAADCGGCAWIGRPYAEQRRRKTAAVRDALAAVCGLDTIEVLDCAPAPRRTAYRNRAKLAVLDSGERVDLGLFRTGSNRVVDLAPCRVQGEAGLATVERVGRWLGRKRLAAPGGPVKHVDVREAAAGRAHLTLVLDRTLEESAELPVDELRAEAPELVGISVNVNPARSSYVFGPQTRTLWGERSFRIEVAGPGGAPVAFEVPATGFFQVNVDPLPVLHERMAQHLGADGPLLDLYCGVGLHGLMLGLRLGHAPGALVGVEESAASAACARRNADRVGIGARFVTGRVERVLPGVLEEQAPRRVILNPGRAGCKPPALEGLGDSTARRLAYVSCNPAALARDLAVLVGAGFRVVEVQPFDLMPQTDHVEVLALLER